MFYFFFSRKNYIQLAISHDRALDIKCTDLKEKHLGNSLYTSTDDENDFNKALENAQNLDKAFRHSFFTILFIALIAIVIEFFTGKINTSLQLNTSLASIFIGTYLTSWATLMALGENVRSWAGVCLHEILSPAIFKIMFIPGAVLILIGTII